MYTKYEVCIHFLIKYFLNVYLNEIFIIYVLFKYLLIYVLLLCIIYWLSHKLRMTEMHCCFFVNTIFLNAVEWWELRFMKLHYYELNVCHSKNVSFYKQKIFSYFFFLVLRWKMTCSWHKNDFTWPKPPRTDQAKVNSSQILKFFWPEHLPSPCKDKWCCVLGAS